MLSISWRSDSSAVSWGSNMALPEVQAVQQQVATLISRFPACPAVSQQVDDRLRVGPLQIENHRVTEYAATDGHSAGKQNGNGHAATGENELVGVNRRVRISPAPGHSCAALVVPQLADGRYGMVLRYRFAPAKWSLEFPRALADDDDETWRDTCDRVLNDALGWAAGDMSLLGSIQLDPACMTTRLIIAVGQTCTPQRVVGWDPNQMIAGCVAVSQQALDQLVLRGDVECSATIAALSLVRLHGANASRPVAESPVACEV